MVLKPGQPNGTDQLARCVLACSLCLAAQFKPKRYIGQDIRPGKSAKSWKTRARSGPGPVMG